MNPKNPNRRFTNLAPKSGLQWEQLEPRILYSAAPAEAPTQEAPPEAESADVANATPAPDLNVSVSLPAVEAQAARAEGNEAAAELADQLLEADPSIQIGIIDFGTSSDGQPVPIDLGNPALTQAQAEDALRNLALESISRWQEAGLPEDQLESLYTAAYEVKDLEGTVLSTSEGNRIRLDDNGGGLGWFVSGITGDGAGGQDLLAALMHQQSLLLESAGISGATAMLGELLDNAPANQGSLTLATGVGGTLVTLAPGESPLSQAEVEAIAREAVTRWAISGLSQDQVQVLESIQYQVRDLVGLTVAYAEDGIIVIDEDAARLGWFVDSTPGDDSEFTTGLGATHLLARTDEARRDVDLLTIVMHEQGHILRLGDGYSGADYATLMYGGAEEGVRRLPAPGEAARAVPGSIPERAAASTTVNNFADDGPGTGSLRDAITQAVSGDTITLVNGRYLIEKTAAADNTNATGDFDISNKSIRIVGTGKWDGVNGTLIDAQQLDRVFHIIGTSNVTLENLTITGGLITEGNGGGILHEGGILTLINVSIDGNEVSDTVDNNTNALGGGLYNEGRTVIATNTDFVNNKATRNGGLETAGGGGFFSNGSTANISLTGGIISGNVARDGGGFYVWTEGATVTLSGVTIENNSAITGGGFRFLGGNETDFVSSLTLTDVNITNNIASGAGGGFHVQRPGILTMVGGSIVDNKVHNGTIYVGQGGGFYNSEAGIVNLSNVSIADNGADEGGGFYNVRRDSVVTGTNVTLSGNYGEVRGGAFHNAQLGAIVNLTDSVIGGSRGQYVSTGSSNVTFYPYRLGATNLTAGGLESDANVSVIEEQSGLWLTSDLAVDAVGTANATFDSLFTPTGLDVIGAEQSVSSHLVHVDRTVDGSNTATIVFDSAILGLIWLDATLNGSDTLLGNGVSTYPHAVAGRGADLASDSFSIDATGKILTISLSTLAANISQFRVITDFSGNAARNEHGGGFYTAGEINLVNTAVRGNESQGRDEGANRGDSNGGGFYVTTGGSVNISGTGSIEDNRAFGHGGGFFNRAGSVMIDGAFGADIKNNAAGVDTADAARHGGGFFTSEGSEDGTGSVVTLTGVELIGNTVSRNAAGLVTGLGGGFYAGSATLVNLNTVDISNHTADAGGAFYVTDALTKVVGANVTLDSNVARTRGGAFQVANTLATVELTNSRIDNNIAQNEHGGGFYNNGTVTLLNTTVDNNQALDLDADNADLGAPIGTVIVRNDSYGGGFYNGAGIVNLNGATSVSNNKAWGHAGGFFNSGGIVNSTGSGTVISGNEIVRDPIALTSADADIVRHGGGFYNDGDGIIDLDGVTISGNMTGTDTAGNIRNTGGGFYNVNGSKVTISGDSQIIGNLAEEGGAFFNTSTGGTVSIIGTNTDQIEIGTLANPNIARVRGGAFRTTGNTTVNLSFVDISHNVAQTERGGGIYADGATIIGDHLNITNNSAIATGGNRHGGGLFLSADGLTQLTDSTIAGNFTQQEGGGFYLETGQVDLIRSSVTGNQSTAGQGGGFYVTNNGIVSLTDSAVTSNIAFSHGGGFTTVSDSQVTAIRSNIDGNLAGYINATTRRESGTAGIGGTALGADLRGGGFYAANAARITLIDSTLSNNETATYGGAANMENEATLILDGTTVSGNVGDQTGGAFRIATNAHLLATNTTISGNYAGFARAKFGGTVTAVRDGASAGGIWALSGGNVVTFNHVTLTDNYGTASTGAGIVRSAGSVTAENSILFGNHGDAEKVQASWLAADTSGTITLVGANVLGASSGTVTLSSGAVRITTDPGLGALADNGGVATPGGNLKTHTIAMAGSAENVAINSRVATDQRGLGRSNATADLGALELSTVATKLTVDELTVPENAVSGATVSLTALATTTGAGSLIYTWSATPSGTGMLSAISGQGTASASFTFAPSNDPIQFVDVVLTVTNGLGQTVISDVQQVRVVDPNALPATFTTSILVDKLGDENDGDVSTNGVTLREAINLANASVAGNVEITFAGSLDTQAILQTLQYKELNYDAQGTGGVEFTIGARLTQGATTATIIDIIGDSGTPDTTGTLVLQMLTGTNFTDNVALSDDNGGSALANGSLFQSLNTGYDYDITKTNGIVVFKGNGTANTIISGNNNGRVFDIRPDAKVIFKDLTITGGGTANTNGSEAHGGGVKNEGGIGIFQGVAITGNAAAAGTNSAVGGGLYTTSSERFVGLIYMDAASSIANNTAEGNGGGLYMAGSNVGESFLYLNGTLIDGNVSGSSGGAIDSLRGGGFHITDDGNRVVFNNVTVSNNQTKGRNAVDGGGGAFSGSGTTVEINGGFFIGNIAGDGGNAGTEDADGGGFWVGGTRQNITLTGVDLGGELAGGADAAGIGTARANGNFAEDQGGAFYMEGHRNVLNLVDTKIIGNQANDGGGGFMVANSDETVNISQTVLDGGVIRNNFSAREHGGGIRNEGGIVNVTGTAAIPFDIRYNEARGTGTADRVGGGIYNLSNARTNLVDVRIHHNRANTRGAGFYNSGGATLNLSSSTSSTSGTEVSFVSQITDNVIVDLTTGDGAGFYNTGYSFVNLTDVLITRHASGDEGAGFINESNFSEVNLVNVDLTNNIAQDNGGGFYNRSNASIVTLSNVLIDRNQSVTEHGGGFRNNGIVTGNLVTVTNNQAGDTADSTSLDYIGGGIFNSVGTLTLEDAIIDNNTATGRGGGIYNGSGGIVTITSTTGFRSSISGNQARLDLDTTGVLGSGGGIFQESSGSTTYLTGVDMKNNVAADNGGGIFSQSDGAHVHLTDVLVQENTAGDEGGGIMMASSGSLLTLNNVSIIGNSTLDVHGGGIRNLGVVTGSFITIVDNSAGTANALLNNDVNSVGGGIYTSGSYGDVTLSNVAIVNNSAWGRGGGIYQDTGVISLTDFVISGNTTEQGTSETNGRGGGIWNNAEGDIVLERGTISGNKAFGFGGGIYQQDYGSTITATNVTISSNIAGWDVSGGALINGRDGGGIYTTSQGAILVLSQVTVSLNEATRNGGGVIRGGGKVKYKNSILSGNLGDVDGTAFPSDNNADAELFGAVIIVANQGGTLTNNDPTFESRVVIDPNLAALANNDGPAVGATGSTYVIQTHAIDSNSSAAGAAVNTTVTVDGRNIVRPVGFEDVGAYQRSTLGSLSLANTTATPLAVTEGATVTVSGDVLFNLTDDPLGADAWVIVNWGDGTPSEQQFIASGSDLSGLGDFSFTHAYNYGIDGIHNLQVYVSDVDGGPAVDLASFTVTVTDVDVQVVVSNTTGTTNEDTPITIDPFASQGTVRMGDFTIPASAIEAAGNRMGYSVAIDGDLAVIGGEGQGNLEAVWVYRNIAGVWSLEATLYNEGDGNGGVTGGKNEFDDFGFAVTVDATNQRIFVGAHLDDTGGTDKGAVHYFQFESGSWVWKQKIQAGDSFDDFGNDIAVSGNTLVIGARLEDTGGTDTGAVYVFVHNGTNFALQQKIQESPVAASNQFGWSVDIDGETLIVGQELDDNGGSNSGAAYVYTRTGTVWTLQQKINSSAVALGTVDADDRFGYDVAISGDTVAIGARLNDIGGSNRGSVHIFTRSAGVWTESQILGSGTTGVSNEDQFGARLDIDGDRLIVGGYLDDGPNNSGTAYIFDRASSVAPFALTQQIEAADNASEDEFGFGVAISGSNYLIGARVADATYTVDAFTNITISQYGAAYIFTGVGAGNINQVAKLDGDLATATEIGLNYDFGRRVAIEGNFAVIGAPRAAKGTSSANDERIGEAYVYQRNDQGTLDATDDTWTLIATLTPPSNADDYDDYFGHAVSVSEDGSVVAVGAYLDDDSGGNSGAVYIFAADPIEGGYIYQGKIKAGAVSASDDFGRKLQLSEDGNTLAVGMRLDDDRGGDSGSVQVYDVSATNWSTFFGTPGSVISSDGVKLKGISEKTAIASSEFGMGVAISGNRIVVGSYTDDLPDDNSADTTHRNRGSAYVFERDASNVHAILDPLVDKAQIAVHATNASGITAVNITVGTGVLSVTQAAGVVTINLAAGGSTAAEIVTAINAAGITGFTAEHFLGNGADDALNDGSGLITAALNTTLTNWELKQKLVASNPGKDDQYGRDVDIDGDIIVVGSPLEDSNIGVGDNNSSGDSGAAYVYELSGGRFVETLRLKAVDLQGSDQFGFSVALDGTDIVVGAFTEDTGGNQAGSVYVFRKDAGTGQWAQTDILRSPDGSSLDQFGISVDIKDGTVVVGATNAKVTLANGTTLPHFGAAYSYQLADPATANNGLVRLEDLTLPDGTTLSGGNRTGYSVDIHGDLAVIGSEAQANQEEVYIYRYDGFAWNLEATLINPAALTTGTDGDQLDDFGSSVGVIDGATDRVFVGARLEDAGGTDKGRVYFYEYNTTTSTWDLKQQITDGDAGDDFGWALAVDGDTLVVSARLQDSDTADITDHGGSDDSGAVWVYTYNSGTGMYDRVAKLKAQLDATTLDVQGGDQFGIDVAISNGTIVVGQELEDSTPNNAGAAYVYVFNTWTGLWEFQQKIKASNAGNEDRFGFKVAISDDTIVVGARLEDTGAGDAGAAYVFTRTAGVWTQTQQLGFGNAASISGSDQFGTSVGISGDRILVGSYLDDAAGGALPDSGRVYVYERTSGIGNSFNFVEELVGDDTTFQDHFGYSLAIDGDRYLAGARQADATITVNDITGETLTISQWGAAYIFQAPGTGGGATQTAKLDGDVENKAEIGGKVEFGRRVVISGDFAVVGAPRAGKEPNPNTNSDERTGRAYVYHRNDMGTSDASDDTWTLVATIAPPVTDDDFDDFFGHGIDISEDGSVLAVGSNLHEAGGTNQGAVFIYTLNATGDGYDFLGRIRAANRTDSDEFGRQVTLNEDGTVLAVASYADDDTAGNAGAVLIYDVIGSDWTTFFSTAISEQSIPSINSDGIKIQSASPVASDFFGRDLALSGTTLVVGAYADDDLGSNSGAAFVFDRNTGGAGNWGQTQVLLASNGGANDQFGLAVDIDGSRIVIGAYLEDSLAVPTDNSLGDSGAVYVFDRAGGDGTASWAETQLLKASDRNSSDQFGVSVAVDGNVIVVGAYLQNTGNIDDGAVYVFQLDGASWTETNIIRNPQGGLSDQFGRSVDVSNGTIVAGAYQADKTLADGTVINQHGRVFTYQVTPADLSGANNALTITSVTPQVAFTTATATTDGATITFDPGRDFDYLNQGESVDVLIDYVVSNGAGGTVTATLTVTVTGKNDSPVAVDDTDSVSEDGPALTGNLLTNDLDDDQNTTLVIVNVNGSAANVGVPVTLTSGAVLTVNANGTYTYNPNGQFESLGDGDSATDSFTYQVSDSSGQIIYQSVNGTFVGEAEIYSSRAGDGGNFWQVIGESNVVENVNGFAGSREGSFVQTPNAGGSLATPVPGYLGQPGIAYQIEVAEAGTYQLFVRGAGYDGNSDSLYATIVNQGDNAYGGDADWYRVLLPTGAFQWVGTGAADNTDSVTAGVAMEFTLSAGLHTIYLSPREDGVAVDSWMLRKSDSIVAAPAANDVGPNAQQVGTVTITVNGVNDAPTATNLTSISTYTEGAASVAIADIVISDVDVAETITATLTLNDTSTGVLTTSGTATYTAGTGVWTITGTVANVNAALAALSFTPATNNELDTTVNVVIDDGNEDGGSALTGTITLDVTPVNDPPTATNLTSTSTYTEGAASVAISDIVVSDVDAAETITATLTLAAPATGVLTTSGTATYTAGTGVWTITGTVANVNAALAALSFTPATNNDLDTTISVVIDDGNEDGGGALTGTITLDVTPVNDPPAATNLTTTSSYIEGAASVAITDIVVSDVDTGEIITATLTLADTSTGALTTSGTATYAVVTGVWTITGTVANVNAALAAVSFTPAANNDQSTTISVVIDDGNEDGGGALTGTITLDVTPVNNPPTATNLTSISTYTEGAASVAITDIVVSDVDTAEIITATLTLANPATGVLTTSGTATYTAGTGVWTITGTVANVNAALAALSFTPATNNDVDTTIGVVIDDGNEDGGGALNGTITLDVTPVNDAPVPANNTVSLSEVSLNGTVVYTVAPNDPDTGDTHTFTITGGNTNNTFSINASGQIVVNDENQLGAGQAYSLVVAVRDQGGTGLIGNATITVNVTDADTPPTAVTLQNTVTSRAEGTDTTGLLKVADIIITDDGSGTNVLSLAGADVGKFSISGTALYFNDGVLDFDTQTSYSVAVNVDGVGVGSAVDAFATFIFSVTNVAPTAQITGTTTGSEGTTVNLTGSGSDPGPSNEVLTYAWTVSKNGTPGYASGTGTAIGFTPDDNGSYVVSLTATDPAGLAGTAATHTVTVGNVAPTALNLTLNTATINEGGGVTLGGSFTDPGTLDTHTVVIDWGDGTPTETVNLSAGVVSFSGRTHTYADDNPTATGSDPYTISVTLRDNDEATVASQTTGVTVNNVAPTLTVVADQTVYEGSTLNLTNLGTFTDPGFGTESFVYFVDWGDGTSTVTGSATVDADGSPGVLIAGSFDGSHVYADDGNYTVTVRLADDDMSGNFAGTAGTDFVQQTFNVAVANAAPTFTVLSGEPSTGPGAGLPVDLLTTPQVGVNSVGTVTIQVTVTDPGFDFSLTSTQENFTAQINWGDGSVSAVVLSPGDFTLTEVPGSAGVATVVTFSATHTYTTGPLLHTVSVKIADDNMSGNFAGVAGTDFSEATFEVAVDNVSPALAIDPVNPIDEGGTAVLTGRFTDPGIYDLQTVTIRWGDPHSTPASVFALSRVVDLTAGDRFTAPDGSTLIVTGVAPGGVISFRATHLYAEDAGPGITGGVMPIHVSVSDGIPEPSGYTGNQADTTVTVSNVMPAVSLDPPASGQIGEPTVFDGSFTDPGLLDTHVIVLDFGDPGNPTNATFALPATNLLASGNAFHSSDGSSVLTITGIGPANGQVSFRVSHVYEEDGIHTASLTVGDDDGGLETVETTVTVYLFAPVNGGPGFFTDQPGAHSLKGITSIFNNMGEPDSLFVGFAGPSTLDGIGQYFPGSGYGRAGTFFNAEGMQQTLVPVFSGLGAIGWGVEIVIYDRLGYPITSVSGQIGDVGSWLLALPGVNLADAATIQIMITPPQTGYAGYSGTPGSLLDGPEGSVFGANITGLFGDLDGLFETGLLDDDGDILGQLLDTVSLQ